MTRDEQAEQAAFPNTFRQGWNAAVAIIDQHIPSLTDQDDVEIDERIGRLRFDPDDDSGNEDLALRTCACGANIDGFYEYVDHLKEVLA
jgi:hypothetical protein